MSVKVKTIMVKGNNLDFDMIGDVCREIGISDASLIHFSKGNTECIALCDVTEVADELEERVKKVEQNYNIKIELEGE